MPREPAIDARVIGATVKIEVCKKVERKFRQSSEDSLSTIYARALEDSVRDVKRIKRVAAEKHISFSDAVSFCLRKVI